MSNIHNETLLETIYDEVWEEYRDANCLSDDQLYALEQSSETGTLPEIELETNRRFEELINIQQNNYITKCQLPLNCDINEWRTYET